MVFFARWTAFLADRDHRGLVEHDALAAHVDQGVGGTQIDGEVVGEIAAQNPNMCCLQSPYGPARMPDPATAGDETK